MQKEGGILARQVSLCKLDGVGLCGVSVLRPQFMGSIHAAWWLLPSTPTSHLRTAPNFLKAAPAQENKARDRTLAIFASDNHELERSEKEEVMGDFELPNLGV